MYNAEKTIVNAIQSVLNQTKKVHEIIIVNDGSKDETLKIAKKYISNYSNIAITLLDQENKGVSAARNAAIKVAKGDYIAFLDADDEWHPQKIEMMSYCINKNPGYNLYSHMFGIKGQTTQVYRLEDVKYSEISLLKSIVKNKFVTPSVIIKNKYLFDEDMRYAEDHDLWINVLSSPPYKALLINLKLVFLSRPVLSVGGASENKWLMRKGEMHMYSKLGKRKFYYYPLIPLLISISLMKHVIKKIFK